MSHHEEWFFTSIYASPFEENRQDIWRNLKRIDETMRIRWMIGGDFNDILNANEKKMDGLWCLKESVTLSKP